MTYAQVIKMALAYKGISEAELARRMKVTPQTLHKRFKVDKFSSSDMEEIAALLEGEFEVSIKFPSGVRVSSRENKA